MSAPLHVYRRAIAPSLIRAALATLSGVGRGFGVGNPGGTEGTDDPLLFAAEVGRFPTEVE
jgi:hypothetical protein